jgi:hypothetical protein
MGADWSNRGRTELNQSLGLLSSMQTNFGFVRNLALYVFAFIVETATIYS